ncbi:XRE family transcriptional regulator [Pseudomonas sp. GD03860]|uniref:LexA family protein n=1 Tax=Pseudomonas sp. GD03860 TaxID=2975389 RepID=UPI002447B4B5|nr:XRE family transcriptional regulator [Pseudomonas sp. GD03860]MDH0639069.1 XRE family transcriptional regulator [Pseudomonas sp. GD03860]
MEIGQRIRNARKARGLTLEALANQVDTDTGNLSRLERGKQGASQELLTKIFNVLQLEVSHIRPKAEYAGGAYELDNIEVVSRVENRPRKGYPLISWVTAGEWAESPDNFQPGDAEDWIGSTENAGSAGFWLKVRGDSMTCAGNPSFPAESLILVRPEADVISGKYYVVEMLDSGEKTFKQYVEDAGLKYLRPLNPSYRTIEIDGNCRFIGRVIDTKMTGL